MHSQPMFTCETTQDRSLRSEYVHVMGGGDVKDQFLNYLISVSPSLYRLRFKSFKRSS